MTESLTTESLTTESPAPDSRAPESEQPEPIEPAGRILTALRVSREALDLSPAPVRRAWMEQTPDRFANRCLPLLIANQAGWFVTTRRDVTVTWDGGPGRDALRIDSPVQDGDGYGTGLPVSHFGAGVLTWTLPWLFRTPPGWNLLVRGPANWPRDGAQALEGVVETDWAYATFTVNWLLTRAGLEVTFPAGDPIAMIVPQRRGELEEFTPEVAGIEGTGSEQDFREWSAGRAAFNADLAEPGSAAARARWQRNYFQGLEPAAVAAGHQRRLSLQPFRRGSP